MAVVLVPMEDPFAQEKSIVKETCDNCKKEFKKAYIKDHKKLCTGKGGFPCDECSKVFIHTKRLIFHVNKVHRNSIEQIVCDVCGKHFNREASHSVHKQVHKGETFGCEVCPKIFLSPNQLKEHFRHAHNPKQTVKCDLCNKVFACKQNVEKHVINVHDKGDKK